MSKRTDVNTLGEFGLIKHLTASFNTRNRSTIKSIGDDAAVIDNGNYQTVVSTDMLMEGIHFDLAYTPLKHLGYKAVVVNVSDIYAMNCTPKQITVSIALSNRFSVEAMEELYAGIKEACKTYNVDLIGGDTTSSLKGLAISVTAIGQGEKGKIVYRNGAKVGDIICATGDFGAAYLGLQLLEREKQIYLEHPDVKPDLEDQAYLVGRLLKPEAQKAAIAHFKNANLIPTAMIDVSDGLSSELYHICQQSQTGAYLEEDKLMIHPEAKEMALKFLIDPTVCILDGGEDYELLFTIRPEDLDKVRYMPNIAIIGEIVDKADGITLHTGKGNIHPIKPQGWQHI